MGVCGSVASKDKTGISKSRLVPQRDSNTPYVDHSDIKASPAKMIRKLSSSQETYLNPGREGQSRDHKRILLLEGESPAGQQANFSSSINMFSPVREFTSIVDANLTMKDDDKFRANYQSQETAAVQILTYDYLDLCFDNIKVHSYCKCENHI
jgi:hypothetical protein